MTVRAEEFSRHTGSGVSQSDSLVFFCEGYVGGGGQDFIRFSSSSLG